MRKSIKSFLLSHGGNSGDGEDESIFRAPFAPPKVRMRKIACWLLCIMVLVVGSIVSVSTTMQSVGRVKDLYYLDGDIVQKEAEQNIDVGEATVRDLGGDKRKTRNTSNPGRGITGLRYRLASWLMPQEFSISVNEHDEKLEQQALHHFSSSKMTKSSSGDNYINISDVEKSSEVTNTQANPESDVVVAIHENTTVEMESDIVVEVEENNTISILTFSLGQPYCDENALLNAYYQIRPPGIEMIELLFYETSLEPSIVWQEWVEKYQTSHFSIRYKWYNASIPWGTELNPYIGRKRNDATKAARGFLVVNMDNDDVFHPDYVRYAVRHLSLNPTWYNVAVVDYATTNFNPDGTYNIVNGDPKRYNFTENKIHTIAASWSTKRELFTVHNCWWRPDVDKSEEHNVKGCVLNKKIPMGHVNSNNGTYGNDLIMLKIISPLSITNQIYQMRSELFNRLTIDDTSNLINAMSKFYRDMHELQRSSLSQALTEPLATIPKVRDWQELHRRHPQFTSRRNHPHCEGFAGLSGISFLPVTNKTTLYSNIKSSAACCKMCSDMANVTAAEVMKNHSKEALSWADDIEHNFCGGFTYDISAKTCLLGIGDRSMSPWRVTTHEAGIRIEPTCPRCGKNLDPIPFW